MYVYMYVSLPMFSYKLELENKQNENFLHC